MLDRPLVLALGEMKPAEGVEEQRLLIAVALVTGQLERLGQALLGFVPASSRQRDERRLEQDPGDVEGVLRACPKRGKQIVGQLLQPRDVAELLGDQLERVLRSVERASIALRGGECQRLPANLGGAVEP